MSKREDQLRYQLLLNQLEVIRRFWIDFENKLGEGGREELINQILDEMLVIRNRRRKK